MPFLRPQTNAEKIFGTPNPTDEQKAELERKRPRVEKPDMSNVPMDDTSEETFNNTGQLLNVFKQGKLNWPEILKIGDVKYTFLKSYTKGIIDIMKKGKDGYIIYQSAADKKQLKSLGMGQWMVFLFGSNGSTIAPKDLGFVSASQGKVLYESQSEIIGDVVLLKITLPSGVVALKGKVDTGAEISSLHTDTKPEVIGDSVRFTNHNASGNSITAPLVTQQAVNTSDGGTEHRPVIELDIEINGKPISKAQFNLNDRSSMEYQVLVGQNVLEKTGFLIDPSKSEEETIDVHMDSFDLESMTDDEIMSLLEGEIFDIITEEETEEKEPETEE